MKEDLKTIFGILFLILFGSILGYACVWLVITLLILGGLRALFRNPLESLREVWDTFTPLFDTLWLAWFKAQNMACNLIYKIWEA